MPHTVGLILIGAFVIYCLCFTWCLAKEDIHQILKASRDAKQGKRIRLSELDKRVGK